MKRLLDDLTPREQLAEELVGEVLDGMLLPLEVRRYIHVQLVGYLLVSPEGQQTIERLLDEVPPFEPGKQWAPDPEALEAIYDDVLRRWRFGLGGLVN